MRFRKRNLKLNFFALTGRSRFDWRHCRSGGRRGRSCRTGRYILIHPHLEKEKQYIIKMTQIIVTDKKTLQLIYLIKGLDIVFHREIKIQNLMEQCTLTNYDFNF